MASPTPRPRKPKPPAPPKPWQREDGRYRSDDGRFTIEGGGAGRWFVTDEGSLDELGLARTLGPFDTLDDAKAAAADARGREQQASPLADRLTAARDRPGTAAPAATRAPAGTRTAGRAPGPDATAATPALEPAPEPPPRTWLDDLEDEDAPAAARARRLVTALAGLGLEDADAVVRRDVLGRQPAVAARLLGHTIDEALRAALEAGSLDDAARRTIPGPMRELATVDEPVRAAYAAFVAGRVVGAVLGVVSAQDRADGAGRDLPGWRLEERPAARDGADAPGRRLIVTRDDVGA